MLKKGGYHTYFTGKWHLGEADYALPNACLLYTSDAADERSSVDLGGRRIIKKKTEDRDSGAYED